MNILLTGSAGFIGMHTAKRLLEDGHHVTGLDNLNEYYDVRLKQARLKQLDGQSHFTPVVGDLFDRALVDQLMKQGSFDVVINLAAQAGVRYSLDNPHAYGDANLTGFLNLLEACRHAEVPRLVYASSSSVYGGNQKLPFSEDDPVDRPVSLYAATKKANELMAHAYSHLYGVQTVGLRFFTVYGPWGRPDMAYWLFTEALLAGKPIKVFNQGNMQRDFTYIDDIVDGVVAAAHADGLDPWEIINLGNNRSENLMDFISVIAEALGVEPEMELLPMQPGDVPATYADTRRAAEKLGFSAHTDMREGIPLFVEWFRDYHQR